MQPALDWTLPVAVAELPAEGTAFEIVADEATRAALARHAGVLAVPSLVARLHVRPDGRGGAVVDGTLEASVRQNCVVTLDPFDNAVREPVSLRFAPPRAIAPDAGASAGFREEDPPDPLVDGRLDLAAVVAEFLALSVDPYPRRPGAEFVPPETGGDTAAARSPFAALEKLRRKDGDEKP